MNKLDHFLDENHNSIKQEKEMKGPCCVMLIKDMSDEEIIDEIHKFCEKHENIHIALYADKTLELNVSKECNTE